MKLKNSITDDLGNFTIYDPVDEYYAGLIYPNEPEPALNESDLSAWSKEYYFDPDPDQSESKKNETRQFRRVSTR